MKILKPVVTVIIILSALFILSGCTNNDDFFANISLTEGIDGDIGGDFTGNGGSASETFAWKNDLSTADYNADITAAINGLFQMIIKDSEGSIVLERSLNGKLEPDTFSGVTRRGKAGMWTVTIIITDFMGDGSFSLSEGD